MDQWQGRGCSKLCPKQQLRGMLTAACCGTFARGTDLSTKKNSFARATISDTMTCFKVVDIHTYQAKLIYRHCRLGLLLWASKHKLLLQDVLSLSPHYCFAES